MHNPHTQNRLFHKVIHKGIALPTRSYLAFCSLHKHSTINNKINSNIHFADFQLLAKQTYPQVYPENNQTVTLHRV